MARKTVTTTLRLDPQTVALNFASVPSGLQLAVNATSSVTPFSRTVIIGSSNSVSATTPQSLNGTGYTFSSWSDGQAQTHNITAPATTATFTATYSASSTLTTYLSNLTWISMTPTPPPSSLVRNVLQVLWGVIATAPIDRAVTLPCADVERLADRLEEAIALLDEQTLRSVQAPWESSGWFLVSAAIATAITAVIARLATKNCGRRQPAAMMSARNAAIQVHASTRAGGRASDASSKTRSLALSAVAMRSSRSGSR